MQVRPIKTVRIGVSIQHDGPPRIAPRKADTQPEPELSKDVRQARSTCHKLHMPYFHTNKWAEGLEARSILLQSV